MTSTKICIPDELKQFSQWVLWRYEVRDGKKTKVPYQTDGRMASTTDANTWSNYKSVMDMHSTGSYAGIGFVVTALDNYCGVDLDHCRNSETGEIEQWAKDIVNILDSYTEITPSMEGIRVWLKAKLLTGGNRKGNIEIYEQGRYFTITGKHLDGTPTTIENRQQASSELHANIFSSVQKENKGNGHHSNMERADTEILQKAMAVANGAAFSRLWQGDTSDYDEDDSRADLALCSMLAFWTSNNQDRIDTLFRQSGLYREKWERKDYRQGTITKAVENNHDTYKPGYRENHNNGHKPDEEYIVDPADSLTDLGNAWRLVNQFGEILHYSYKRDKWLVWNGKYWVWDEGEKIDSMAELTIRKIYHEVELATDKTQRQAIAEHARKSESNAKLKAMVEQAKHLKDIPINLGQLDSNQCLFNVDNGTIDLRTGELLSHRKEDLITVMVPVIYDKTAICPKWLKFLDRATSGNKELQSYLQRGVGLSLTGDVRSEVIFLLYGLGNNGKSTFTMTIRKLMAGYGHRLDAEDLMVKEKQRGGPKEGIADLNNKRYVVCSEIQDGRTLDCSLVKDLTGGETIKARRMYEHEVEYMPTAKLWLYGNHKPVIKDSTLSIWRRVKLIPFGVTIPAKEVNENLKDELAEELPGILNWAIEGCLAWQRDNLGTCKLVSDATADYRHDSDILGDFLEDKCVITQELMIVKKDMKELYAAWCSENGVEAVSQVTFKKRLLEKGIIDWKGTAGKRYWKGVGNRIENTESGEVAESNTNSIKSGDTREQADFLVSPDNSATLDVNGKSSATNATEKITFFRCSCCGNTDWWQRQDTGEFVCTVCHPQPVNELDESKAMQ